MRKHRRNSIKKIVSIIFYIINIVAVFYPWIVIGTTKYNFLQLKSKIDTLGIEKLVEQSGMMVDNPGFIGFSINVQFVFYYIFILLCIGYILTTIFGKNWRLNGATFFVAVGIVILNGTGYSIASICTGSIQGLIFPLVHIGITVIEIIVTKLLEQKEIVKKNY